MIIPFVMPLAALPLWERGLFVGSASSLSVVMVKKVHRRCIFLLRHPDMYIEYHIFGSQLAAA
jgi:hypothetical protein